MSLIDDMLGGNVKRTIDEIEKDCLTLKKQGYLTEYGEGQLDLVRMLKKELRTNKRSMPAHNFQKIRATFL